MNIDDALIHKLETLSRLKLEEDEKIHLKAELQSIVQMFAKIGEVDTTGIEPLRHMTETSNIMRDDVPLNELSQEQGLLNAPLTKEPYFAIPKVIE